MTKEKKEKKEETTAQRYRRKNMNTGYYSVTLPSGKGIVIFDKDTFTAHTQEDIDFLEQDSEIEKVC